MIFYKLIGFLSSCRGQK